VLETIPFDAPPPPVLSNSLHELRVDELRAGEQPVRSLLTDDEALDRPRAVLNIVLN
jgi:hypothetical protein